MVKRSPRENNTVRLHFPIQKTHTQNNASFLLQHHPFGDSICYTRGAKQYQTKCDTQRWLGKAGNTTRTGNLAPPIPPRSAHPINEIDSFCFDNSVRKIIMRSLRQNSRAKIYHSRVGKKEKGHPVPIVPMRCICVLLHFIFGTLFFWLFCFALFHPNFPLR